MKKSYLVLLLFVCKAAFSQNNDAADTTWKHIYRAEATKINDLVHTKLDVRFDYGKSYMYGKEWLTVHPHFYLEGEDTLIDVAQELIFRKVPDALPGHEITRLDVIVHIRRKKS